MSWFKTFDSSKNTKTTERRKISFQKKKIVENADPHKAVLNKIMSKQE